MPGWQLVRFAVRLLLVHDCATYLERDRQQRHYQQILVEVDQPIAVNVEVFHEEAALRL